MSSVLSSYLRDQLGSNPWASRHDWACFQDDFIGSVLNGEVWTGTATGSGQAENVNEQGGVLKLDNHATSATTGYQIQLQNESFGLPPAGVLALAARVEVSDVLNSRLFCGFSTVDTTVLASEPNDLVGVYVNDGSAALEAVTRRDGSDLNSTSSIHTMVNNTWIEFALLVKSRDGSGANAIVEFAINGAKVADHETTTFPYNAEEIMTPTLAYLRGSSSGASFANVDWVEAYCNRF